MARSKKANADCKLKAARRLITKLAAHLNNAVPFYGYQAPVEDLQEENQQLQRECKAFSTGISKTQLMAWLTYLFDQYRMRTGAKPGMNLTVDKIGKFLGFSQWQENKARPD